MADAAYYYATAPSDGGNVNMVSNQMMTDGGNQGRILDDDSVRVSFKRRTPFLSKVINRFFILSVVFFFVMMPFALMSAFAPEIMEQFFQLPFPIILAFSVVYVLTASFLGIFVASRFGSDEAWKVVTGPSSNKRRRRNRRRRR